jgi:hypothetical protein
MTVDGGIIYDVFDLDDDKVVCRIQYFESSEIPSIPPQFVDYDAVEVRIADLA